MPLPLHFIVLYMFFGGLECVRRSFSYVTHFVSLRYVWIRTQRGAVLASYQFISPFPAVSNCR
jgi:hypothetical protein